MKQRLQPLHSDNDYWSSTCKPQRLNLSPYKQRLEKNEDTPLSTCSHNHNPNSISLNKTSLHVIQSPKMQPEPQIGCSINSTSIKSRNHRSEAQSLQCKESAMALRIPPSTSDLHPSLFGLNLLKL